MVLQMKELLYPSSENSICRQIMAIATWNIKEDMDRGTKR